MKREGVSKFQTCKLYLIRIFTNLIVFAIIAAACILIVAIYNGSVNTVSKTSCRQECIYLIVDQGLSIGGHGSNPALRRFHSGPPGKPKSSGNLALINDNTQGLVGLSSLLGLLCRLLNLSIDFGFLWPFALASVSCWSS